LSADLLELAASLLGDLTGELVFVGGASIHLWLSDPAAPPVRSTDDVDAICDVLGRPAYYRLGERLRHHGFTEAIGDPVICRWRHADSGLTLDVMPTDEAILGFSNPSYPLALATAVERRLPSGTLIRAASPPLILATKLAAWEGRGNGDLLRSLDVHDLIVLADGRPELADELANQLEDVRAYVVDRLGELIDHPYFDGLAESALHGHGRLAGDRAAATRLRLEQMVMTSS
jgi:nucleotidyltransferase AbiEii toxin of type IV toxin-antitoxin system